MLKNHFPGMVGASASCSLLSLRRKLTPLIVFVLNYGWMYAGMWQLAKRILPNTALERILFPSKADLLQFFSPDHLLVGSSFLLPYLTATNPAQNTAATFRTPIPPPTRSSRNTPSLPPPSPPPPPTPLPSPLARPPPPPSPPSPTLPPLPPLIQFFRDDQAG